MPGRIEGVQFGFGQTCGALNALIDRDPTRNWPFLEGVSVAELLSEKVAVCDSTRGRRSLLGVGKARLVCAPPRVRARGGASLPEGLSLRVVALR